jgi:hypothetical protein
MYHVSFYFNRITTVNVHVHIHCALLPMNVS